MSALRTDKKQLEIEIVELQRDLRLFKDIHKVKNWLTTYELPYELPVWCKNWNECFQAASR
jgi:hypothetical protein